MIATISFINELDYPIQELRLKQAVDAVLQVEGKLSPCELSIILVDDDTIRDFNRQYRQVDAPTDVLSFPADVPPVGLPDEPPYLGDLLIAYPYTKAQAEREGHSLTDMLVLLVIHGTLHLLGYDHDTAENKAAMWQAQAEALQLCGIAAQIADVSSEPMES